MDYRDLDATPLDTDWEDLDALCVDMKAFADAHPDHKFICSDDPGFAQKPRVPRMGWTAYSPVGHERAKTWTITLRNVGTSIAGKPDQNSAELAVGFLRTAEGRKRHLESVIGRPASPTDPGAKP